MVSQLLLTTKAVPQRQTKSVEEQSKYLAEQEERQTSLLSAEQLSLICSTEAGSEIHTRHKVFFMYAIGLHSQKPNGGAMLNWLLLIISMCEREYQILALYCVVLAIG